MSLAFAPARPFSFTPDQQPALETAGVDVLFADARDGSAMLGRDRPWADPVGPCIVLDGDDDDDDDDDDDFFEDDDEDEEWEDDYEDDLDDDDDDDEFDDDFEDDDEDL